MECFVVALFLLYTWIFYKNRFHLLFITFFFTVCFEFAVTLWQFAHQAATGLAIETAFGGSFAMGLDENNAIFRVNGTYLFHNQLALITMCYMLFLFMAMLKTRRIIYALGILLCIIIMLLTQSRSVWITAAIVTTWAIMNYKTRLCLLFRGINKRRFIV